MTLVFPRGTGATARLIACGISLPAALLFFVVETAPASADCTSTVATIYVCADPVITSQAISDSDAVVTTLPGFSIDTTISGGPALTIATSGQLSYIDQAASSLISPDYGLYVASIGAGAGFVNIQTNGTISGGTVALFAQNDTLGSTNILATGLLSGGDGLFAVNSNVAGTGDLNITVGSIDATGIGLTSLVYGTGRTVIDVQGSITGTSFIGIAAGAGPGNTDGISVTSNAIAAQSGISVQNSGIGATSVNSLGPIAANGGGGIGVIVFDNANTGDINVDAAQIDSTWQSILIGTSGLGATTVNANGPLTSATDTGIDILGINAASAGGFTINTNAVTAFGHGISVIDAGLGNTLINANGTITAQLGAGVSAWLANSASTGTLTINTQSIRGGYAGIDFENDGLGTTAINIGGTVEGDIGVLAYSLSGAATAITINGEVRNIDQNPGSSAIDADGGPVAITNNNRLTGTLELSDAADTVINNGVWNTLGFSDFHAGSDSIINGAGGTIIAAHDALTNEIAQFDNLESYSGAGTLSLADGGTGDALAMSGNASFGPGAILNLDLAATGANDSLSVSGTADLTNLSVRVSQTGARLIGQTFDTLSALGGLNGRYQGIIDARATAYIGLVDTYDATDAYLTVAQIQPLAGPARTPNQLATAGALNSLSIGDPLVQALLASPTDAAARAALDLLSGDLAPSLQSTLLLNSQEIRDAIILQLRAGFAAETAGSAPSAYAETDLALPSPSDRHIWSQGFGNWGQIASDGNAGRLQTATGGLLAGADASLPNGWRLGAVGGYAATNVSSPDRAASSDVKSYSAGLYGGTQWGAIAFRTGLAYSWNDINSTRAVTLTGLSQVLNAHYASGTTQAFGELAYQAKAGAIDLEPFANLAYVDARTDGFTETGGSAALTTQASATGALFTTLGLRASSKFVIGETTLVTARAMLGWQQGFGTTPAAVSNFAGSAPFTTLGLPVANGSFVAEAGLDFELSEHVKLGVNYAGRLAAGSSDHSVSAKLGIAF